MTGKRIGLGCELFEMDANGKIHRIFLAEEWDSVSYAFQYEVMKAYSIKNLIAPSAVKEMVQSKQCL